MVIREQQMQALEKAAKLQFENRMLAHLKTFAPKHSQVLSEADLRAVIRYGWQRADSYGLS